MIRDLLEDGPTVANVGVADFGESLDAQGVPVVQVDWTPPAALDARMAALLEELE